LLDSLLQETKLCRLGENVLSTGLRGFEIPDRILL